MNQPNFQQNNNYVLPSSTLAIVSLIAGILGFVAMPIIASIVAIWAGYAARNETRSMPPKASGDGMATAGIVMGWIQIALAVVGLCCMLAYYSIYGLAYGTSLKLVHSRDTGTMNRPHCSMWYSKNKYA